MAQAHSDYYGNGSFVIPRHDYQAHTGMTSDHGPTQIVYKKGGANGTIVGTESCTYDQHGHIATRYIHWEPDAGT